jgi:hypothetical protein
MISEGVDFEALRIVNIFEVSSLSKNQNRQYKTRNKDQCSTASCETRAPQVISAAASTTALLYAMFSPWRLRRTVRISVWHFFFLRKSGNLKKYFR